MLVPKKNDIDLQNLNCKLNADEYKLKYKKFDRLPGKIFLKIHV